MNFKDQAGIWNENRNSKINKAEDQPGSCITTPDCEELRFEVKEGALHVAGDIDLFQASVFRKVCEEYIAGASAPKIDITAVPFVDSAGLAVLLALARGAKNQGKVLRVVSTGGPRRVLRITGIDTVISLE